MTRVLILLQTKNPKEGLKGKRTVCYLRNKADARNRGAPTGQGGKEGRPWIGSARERRTASNGAASNFDGSVDDQGKG